MLSIFRYLCLMLTLCSAISTMAQQMDVVWGIQMSSSGEDFMSDVVADAEGNSYIAGTTSGDLEGENIGRDDGYVAKYDMNGVLLWHEQFGTTRTDNAFSIAIDQDCNVYAYGQTSGSLGDSAYGRTDMFIRKYDTDGGVLWTKQIGTQGNDYASHIKIDHQNQVFAVGRTTGDWNGDNQGSSDVVVIKLDIEGEIQWVSQFGSSGADEGRFLAIGESDALFISGQTTGSMASENQGDQDGFLSKLDSHSGEVKWIQQFGTNSRDHARCVAVDSQGYIYVGGWTGGKIGDRNYGGGDAYLGYFDPDGQNIWFRQFGTVGNWDGAHGMVLVSDGSNDVLIGGCWNGPSCHGWMRRYNQQGDLIWYKEIYNRANKSTCGQRVDIDVNGNCYLVGGTDDNLFGTAAGSNDGWAVKIASSTGVIESRYGENPGSFQLNQNYPNPFNPSTKIHYLLQQTSHVRLIISNMAGQVVKTLVDDIQLEGVHDAVWDARDDAGESVGSGIYFCQLTAGKTVKNIKMILMR